MQFQFTGRHVGVDEEDRVYAKEKAVGLARFHPRIQDIEVRVEMDGGRMARVEIEAGLGHHHRAVAHGIGTEFRPSFDTAVDALKRQLKKDKEKFVDRRRRTGARHRPK